MTEQNNGAIGNDSQAPQQPDELPNLCPVDFVAGEHVGTGVDPDMLRFQIAGLLV